MIRVMRRRMVTGNDNGLNYGDRTGSDLRSYWYVADCMPVFEMGALQRCVGNDPDAGQNSECGKGDEGACSRSIGDVPKKTTGEEEDSNWNPSDEMHSRLRSPRTREPWR